MAASITLACLSPIALRASSQALGLMPSIDRTFYAVVIRS
jgi:hypothetical protein